MGRGKEGRIKAKGKKFGLTDRRTDERSDRPIVLRLHIYKEEEAVDNDYEAEEDKNVGEEV